jgi:hypothetical protein
MSARILLAVFVLFPHLAWAWGDLGHQTVAQIAEGHIKPSTKVAIEAILGPEPLAAAATWPDAVRFDPRFGKFDAYHFIEIPPEFTYAKIPSELRSSMDGNTVLIEFPKIVRSATAEREEKMIALRYIIHVLGDIHAPLHVGNGIDQGGNLCQVELTDPYTRQTAITNLHTLWDEGIIGYLKDSVRDALVKKAGPESGGLAAPPPKRYFEYFQFADRIEKDQAGLLARKEEIQRLDLASWYDDSALVRETDVYPDLEAGLDAPVDPKTRPYCAQDPTQFPGNTHQVTMRAKLDIRYLNARVPVVERQILKAGLRLAAFLDWVFQSAAPEPAERVPSELLLRKLILSTPAR